ncbi:hypothetical protein pipiens_011949 [Culex pipiens pipiens]|uniref:Yippee domain-containing protein n=1 Tax=Culex pipiens pipiens TaxID=38569 RepID=A0ABD1D4B4_CULPP
MGKIFLDHIGGQKLYSCAACETNLTNKRELISTRFTGATGRAYLFKRVVNLCLFSCAGPGDADGAAHGAGRDVQELPRQARLDVRVCHRGVAKIQGGPRHPGARAHHRVRGFPGGVTPLPV